MPTATVTLATTSLALNCSATAGEINVASTAGLTPGTRLWIDRELMSVVRLLVDPWVMVQRGVDGTVSQAHSYGTITYGRPDQFYQQDPQGRPLVIEPVSPWINVINGNVWIAQGDDAPIGTDLRFWTLQTITPGIGSLGIRTTTTSPDATGTP